MKSRFRILYLASLCLVLVGLTQPVAAQRVTIPREAIMSAKSLELAPGLTASVFAAEPLVANPVSIATDENGNLFVCETFRQEAGVEDNRDHKEWVDDDLASRSVEDRLALLKKHLKGKELEAYRSKQDRIRMLTDSDRNGQAERSTVFVDGFRDYVDGTGAGVLARKGNVYYTCIPKLYAFRDDNRDGKADRKSTMFNGFGVRFAYRGHDLHGLTIGPDHRLYFSIGDRGYNVKTREGVVADPESGAVFRCELDGTQLEVVATGFRNPQELAFDEFGDLFTCDNNSDSGDQARWLNVIEGADYGWRMAYQYFADRGPWNREELWKERPLDPPAYLIPPISNFSDGPAGLAYYPGTGLSDDYAGNFFLCDFRGQSNLSGVRTFKLKRDGASYKLIDPELFIWKCLATDICFAPDGSMLVSDWVEGWVGTGKGRIYRVVDPKHQKDKAVREVAALLAKGFTRGSTKDLATLLAHVDMRVRMEAQFELARRGEIKTLGTVARNSKIQLAQLHCVWGLGELGRRGDEKTRGAANDELIALLFHPDEEVKTTAIRVLGDNRCEKAASAIAKRLFDDNARIQSSAALALSRIPSAESLPQVVETLAENEDPIVRHACVMALTNNASEAQIAKLADHPSPRVRVAGVLAARRKSSAAVASFLNDEDIDVVREAARAINDVPIPDQYAALAKLATHPSQDDVVVRRALHAHSLLGKRANADFLVEFAADESNPIFLRTFAFGLVSSWDDESQRDRVTGQWRHGRPSRVGNDAVQAVKANLTNLVKSGYEIRLAATTTAAQFGLGEVTTHLVDIMWDESIEGKDRAGAMLSLGQLDVEGLEELCMKAVKADAPRLRAAGRIVLSRLNPEATVPELRTALKSKDEIEKQSAISIMGDLAIPTADNALRNLMTMVSNESLPPELRLDVLLSVEKRREKNPELAKAYDSYYAELNKKDPLALHRPTLEGGNAERGELLFKERIALGCVRCHKIDGEGGAVGPDLTKIGATKSREYLLESMVLPNKEIAKGFDTLVIVTDDGKIVSGVPKKKDKDSIMLMTPEGDLKTIDRSVIDEVSRGKSAMPDDLLTHMTPIDLRDLIEYLSELK